MDMGVFRLTVAAAGLVTMLHVAGARAGDQAGTEDGTRSDFTPRVELTPYIGYRMGGQFNLESPPADTSQSVDLQDGSDWGVDLGIYRDRSSFYELLYSHQSTGLDTSDPSLKGVDVAIEYLQAGGTLLFQDYEHVVPYLSLTLGATRFDAGDGYGSETKFSGSLGGGIRIPFGDHVGATLGLRGYLTVVNSDTEFFCTGSGSVNCLLRTSGSTFFQGEALVGITAVF
jgi:hypothetical protein